MTDAGVKISARIQLVYPPYEYSRDLEMAVNNIVRALVFRDLARYVGYKRRFNKLRFRCHGENGSLCIVEKKGGSVSPTATLSCKQDLFLVSGVRSSLKASLGSEMSWQWSCWLGNGSLTKLKTDLVDKAFKGTPFLIPTFKTKEP